VSPSKLELGLPWVGASSDPSCYFIGTSVLACSVLYLDHRGDHEFGHWVLLVTGSVSKRTSTERFFLRITMRLRC